jgi:catalase
LAEAIEAGAYPKYDLGEFWSRLIQDRWDLGVQLIPEEDEHKFDFDLLDCTKLVPEELVPIKCEASHVYRASLTLLPDVGTMTLNKNPTNQFAEVEQVAFCTSNIIPGIDYSNDPCVPLDLYRLF